MIVWALFDDALSSYKISNEDKDIRIISIGINDLDLEDYYKIDLSLTNNNLVKELSRLPKPDLIIASPPCESWSLADCAGRIYNGDLTYKNKDYYDEYNSKAHKNKIRHFHKKELGRIIGENTGGGTNDNIKNF